MAPRLHRSVPLRDSSRRHGRSTRTAELVLHGLDLATDVEVPPEALVECAAFLVERAVQRGLGVDVVRALSGRGTLPPDVNVY